MAGSISILGLGSSALNADVIDQLRAADEEILLAPSNRRAEENIQQRQDFETLIQAMNKLSGSASTFADELTYLKRSTSYSGDGGTVTAENGINPMSGRIEVEQLAQRHVLQSKGFATQDSIVSGLGGETLTITVDGRDFDVEITAGMSLSDLQQAIVDRTDGAVEASILNTGGDEPYSLIFKSVKEGSDNTITVTSSDTSFDLGLTEIQAAQDAKFSYNGISITRESNKVDDLIFGVTIQLEEAGESINFEVTQDLDGMSDDFAEFVSTYNETVALLNDLTDYDEESGTAASFQGETRVNSIRTAMSRILFGTIGEDNMTQYGLEVGDDGMLIFDQSTFESAMNEDPAAFEALLRGETKVTEGLMISGAVGYTTETVNEIQADGSVLPITRSVPITTDQTFAYGSLKINDISLPSITLLASNTPELNTQLLVSAINSISADTGVRATISASGDKVIMTNGSGGEITITGASADTASMLGLSNGRTSGTTEYSDGLFSEMESYFDSLLVGSESTLGLLETSLKNETDRLDEEISRVKARLDSRYSIMEAQFASYNSIIKGFESNFQALQMQIDAMSSDDS